MIPPPSPESTPADLYDPLRSGGADAKHSQGASSGVTDVSGFQLTFSRIPIAVG